MANIEYDITDPRSEWYSPANQSSVHEIGMLQAMMEGKNDEITQFDRYRTWPKPLAHNPTAEETGIERIPMVTYVTKVPPWFLDTPSQQLIGNPDPNILPLNTGRDPNYAYAQYAAHDRHASNLNNTWKVLANMPTSTLDDQDMIDRRESSLSSLSDRFNSATRKAEEFKNNALSLEAAYNRQILIQGMREFSPVAHRQAQEVEQASKDFAEIDFGLSSGRIPVTKLNQELKNKAMLNLEESMGRWDAGLEKRGLTGPKGPYLLSGFPGQGLDYLGDKAVQDFKNTENKIKEFQSRYSNNSEFRSEVNRGIKSKVPGIITSGIGAYLVKQKMDEGESMPKAIATTAGDIAISTAKFALKDRFVGMTDDLGAPEKDPYANARKQDPMFGLTPYQREQRMNNMSIIENEVNKQVSNMVEKNAIKSVNRSIAKRIREQMDEARVVEENITNSPLWNKQK